MYKKVSHGEVWNAEVCNVNKKGEHYWVDTTIVPFMEDGRPVSYIAIRTDITEKKKDKEELIKASEIAKQSVESKSAFLASMSHEIRTPMNGVIGMLELVMKSELSDTQKHQLTLAQSSATSLLTIINDILDFSKIDAGKMELEYIDFDLRAELGQIAEAMAFKAQENEVELLLDTTYVNESLIKGDSGRIRQILSNIVGNSIKFTHKGYILIRATLNTKDPDNIRLIIDISDTGIGIPEEKIDSLFDSFSQVDASTTRKYGGTGLGLAIVKKLCELMNGDVKVSSNYGFGTTFSVDVEVRAAKDSRKVVPSSSLEGKRALIFDSSDYSIDVLQTQLEYWGMEVYGTCEYEEVLRELVNEKFDILFLDMYIHGVNCEEFASELQQSGELNDMKLVLMTSLKDRGNALKFKELGIETSFPKPATTDDLLKSLSVLDEKNVEEYVENEVVEESIEWNEPNILLVEDNKTNQLVALGMLDDMGLDADIANHGKEALEILNKGETKYDIILMDCQMPVLDGYETTQAIRNNEAGNSYNNVAIIAMTANVMEGDREKCQVAGMDDYIAKPIDSKILKQTLKKWLLEK